MAAEEQPRCCEFMRQQLNYTCDQHDPCPRQILRWVSLSQGEGRGSAHEVVLVDGGGGFYECNYCPSCGAALPQSTDGGEQ